MKQPILAAALIASLAACAAPSSTPPRANAEPFVPAAAAPVRPAEISVAEAFAKSQAGSVLLIDVRTPEEWRETGTAPGAARANWKDEDFIAQASALIGEDKSRPVALICRTGNRSGQATTALNALGYENVVNVAAGMMAPGGWIESGLPVERPSVE